MQGYLDRNKNCCANVNLHLANHQLLFITDCIA